MERSFYPWNDSVRPTLIWPIVSYTNLFLVSGKPGKGAFHLKPNVCSKAMTYFCVCDACSTPQYTSHNLFPYRRGPSTNYMRRPYEYGSQSSSHKLFPCSSSFHRSHRPQPWRCSLPPMGASALLTEHPAHRSSSGTRPLVCGAPDCSLCKEMQWSLRPPGMVDGWTHRSPRTALYLPEHRRPQHTPIHEDLGSDHPPITTTIRCKLATASTSHRRAC